MFKRILLWTIIPLFVSAQFISVKSLPVATGDQFLLYPSKNISMGGVNIALADEWLDAYRNPANGFNILSNSIFLQPTFYNISSNLGGARSIPLNLFLKTSGLFFMAGGAFQQLEAANISNPDWAQTAPLGPTDRYSDNKYLYAGVGTKLPVEGLSAGVRADWADFNAMGGVDLLYSNNARISQDGGLYEIRGGITFQKDQKNLEAVLFYNNFDMKHDVSYIEWIWDEQAQNSIQRFVTENNKDHTDTYGLQFRYREQFQEEGPYIGALFTYNWKTHPKIPNYQVMNIPRDPGNTWAYDFGIGYGVIKDDSRFGIDFIYQPVWSNTWANAVEDINTGERIIKAGQKTIENDFTFDNWIGRIGFNRMLGAFDLSAGLEIYSRSYNLDQFDYIAYTKRSQNEQWTEYTWTWGFTLHFSYFNLQYGGRLLTGSGIPRVNSWRIIGDALFDQAADFIAAPSGSLSTQYESTYTHQFVIQVPLGDL
ncbi:MAG: hypothetical protein H6627_09195 [Calditrichae bacterium]|nr:hypothetical protein [Calditrichia bacterium]